MEIMAERRKLPVVVNAVISSYHSSWVMWRHAMRFRANTTPPHDYLMPVEVWEDGDWNCDVHVWWDRNVGTAYGLCVGTVAGELLGVDMEQDVDVEHDPNAAKLLTGNKRHDTENAAHLFKAFFQIVLQSIHNHAFYLEEEPEVMTPCKWFEGCRYGDDYDDAARYLCDEGDDDWRVVALYRAFKLMKDSGLWLDL